MPLKLSAREITDLIVRRTAIAALTKKRKRKPEPPVLCYDDLAWIQKQGGVAPGVFIPMRVACEANKRGHWAKDHRRNKTQQVALAGSPLQHIRAFNGGMTVTLTRYAPGALDPGDNLPSAFKHVRDFIARRVGKNDRSSYYVWRYEQVRTKAKQYGIRVLVQPKELPHA